MDQDLWRERYHADDVVLSTLVARRAVYLEAGEGVRLTHVAQVCGPGESQVHIHESEDEIRLLADETSRRIDALPVRPPAATQLSGEGRSGHSDAARVFDAGDRIRAMRLLGDGSLVLGSERGVVTFLDPARRPVWSADLDGPVYDIGAAEGQATFLAVGHGESRLTGLDAGGRRIWQTDIEREPCPWPWWELPTPAPVQVEGGIFEGEAFFAVGCGDIQIRGFDGSGREQWRRRYNEGVPGRIRVADVNGCGEPEIIAGGEVLSDTSKCRILDPNGKFQAHLDVEGWTSILTALAFDKTGGRHFIGCGANRGRNCGRGVGEALGEAAGRACHGYPVPRNRSPCDRRHEPGIPVVLRTGRESSLAPSLRAGHPPPGAVWRRNARHRRRGQAQCGGRVRERPDNRQVAGTVRHRGH
ncbi:MAG: hypothetical protein J4F39_14330 [Candidatus Latescibacteria bacterium]|nr:hypothetical protein [Candidatus Latescibacterota bacterium]